MTAMTIWWKATLLLLVLQAATVSSEYELPTKKAIPPKMDPIPTFPVITHRAFLEIESDGVRLGRITLGLFGDIAPKAVENFLGLCDCNRGNAKISGKPMCYRGTKIHRVIPNFMLQGGDYTHGDGTGGESIFGEKFEDESFEVKHNRPYLLGMAGTGKKNSNGSQWFINTVKTQWLERKFQIFGLVLDGRKVIDEIEAVGTYGGKPKAELIVIDSGSLPTIPEDKTPLRISTKVT